MELFWIFVAITVLVLGLLFYRRNSYYSWGWNFLVIVLALYFGLYRVSGLPRNPCFLSSLSNLSGDLEVIHISYARDKAIYLLVRQDPTMQPVYVSLPWDKETVTTAMSAYMTVQERGGALMVRSEVLSECKFPQPASNKDANGSEGSSLRKTREGKGRKSGTEGGAIMFYPKPVAEDPFKIDTIHGNIEIHTPPLAPNTSETDEPAFQNQ